MYKQILTFIIFVSFNSVSFSQQETVGFEYNQYYRHIDSLVTTSGVWSMSYRNELPTNTRIGVSLGLDNVKFFEDDNTSDPMLKSSNQIFAQLEALQILYYIYLKGAVQYYTIKGNVYEVTSSYSEVRYHNDYKMFEFPLSAGLTVPIKDLKIFLGVNKTYFYGSNKKEIFVNNSGTETSLGTTSSETFKSELELGFEGSATYSISEKLDIEVLAVKYKDKDFSFRISIWGPLQRMYF